MTNYDWHSARDKNGWNGLIDRRLCGLIRLITNLLFSLFPIVLIGNVRVVSPFSTGTHNVNQNLNRKSLPLMLFNAPKINFTPGKMSQLEAYPKHIFFLTQPNVVYPVSVNLPTYSKQVPSTLIIRSLSEKDLDKAVRFILDEYGSKAGKSKQISNKENDVIPIQWLENAVSSYEDWGFSLLIKFGLWQRVSRQRSGNDERYPNISPDHNIIICETITGELLGFAEVSLQPNMATRTAPPITYPDTVKKIIAKMNSCDLLPYVSNVLVKPSCRGFGIGKVLMAACEGRAKSMGYESIALHVDANVKTGFAAQRLYTKLGYSCVMETFLNPYENINAKNGIYIIDGQPLLYLSKSI